MDKLDTYIDGVKHLPPAPTLVVELLDLFREPDRDLDRVVELISHEPALTAQILKQCNSAFFAADEPIADMFEAVSRLGFYEVYCLVVGLLGARTMSLPATGSVLSPDVLWQHSVSAAVAAAATARKLSDVEATAFTGGLLHDIGKLLFAAAEPERYAAVLRAAGSDGLALVQVEQAVMRADHSQLGARLLERWKLPANVVAAVRHHHQPANAGEHDRLAATVCLADALAPQLENSQTDAPHDLAEAADALKILQLTANDAKELLEDARPALERIRNLMGSKS